MDIEAIVTREFTEVATDERLGKVRSAFERGNRKGIIVTDDGDYEGVITEKQLLQSHGDRPAGRSASSPRPSCRLRRATGAVASP